MISASDRLYFFVYKWNVLRFKSTEQPFFNAFLFVSFLAFINIVNLSLLTELIANFQIFNFSNYSIWYWIVILLGVLVFHYFFLYKRRCKKIVDHFDSLQGNRSVYPGFYIALSFLLLSGLIFYVGKRPLL